MPRHAHSLKKAILVTAGPTREPIDPVRFISNRSTGLMGYSIAEEAVRRGYKTILVSGPTALGIPNGADYIGVETAVQMRDAVIKRLKDADCLIMAAAVSDFRPANYSRKKIKKRGHKEEALKLRANPDILSEVSRHKSGKIIIGYALESEDVIKNAKAKLEAKKLDVIVANKTDGRRDPFGRGRKELFIIDSSGNVIKADADKAKTARILLDKVETLW